MQKYTFSIGLFGACFDQGQPHAGVGDAPDLIRQGQTLIYQFQFYSIDKKIMQCNRKIIGYSNRSEQLFYIL